MTRGVARQPRLRVKKQSRKAVQGNLYSYSVRDGPGEPKKGRVVGVPSRLYHHPCCPWERRFSLPTRRRASSLKLLLENCDLGDSCGFSCRSLTHICKKVQVRLSKRRPITAANSSGPPTRCYIYCSSQFTPQPRAQLHCYNPRPNYTN